MNLICPFCNKKTTTYPLCSYCFNNIDLGNEDSYLYRMIYLGVRVNNHKMIKEFALKYLAKNPQNELINYYLMYASDDQSRFSLTISDEENFKEIFYHMLKEATKKDLVNINDFIIKQNIKNKEHYLQYFTNYQNNSYPANLRSEDQETLQELTIFKSFSEVIKIDKSLQIALILFVVAGILYILSLFTIKNFALNIKYFATVFTLIIPSLFLAWAFSMLIFKKTSKLFLIFTTLLLIIIISYFFLLKIEPSFLKHINRVLRAFIEFANYLQEVVQP